MEPNKILNKKQWMTKVRERFYGFLKKREGQSTTEYILILAIVVMIASKMKDKLNNTVTNTLNKVEGELGNF